MSRNYVQEQNVELGVVAFLGSLLITLFSVLIGLLQLKRQSKVDVYLTEKINTILKSGNKWIVNVISLKVPNAFTLGFGRHLFVTDTLLQLLNKREVLAVLLHEAYHATKKHGLKYIVFNSTFLAIAASFISTASFGSVLLFLFMMFLSAPLWNVLVSKRLELRADSFAVKCGYGKELQSALEKFRVWIDKTRQPSECTTSVCRIVKKIDQLLSSHPEIEDRVRNILKEIAKLKKPSLQAVKRIILKRLRVREK